MGDPEIRQELQQLRQQLQDAERWANGVFLALEMVLPHLLRDHPQAAALGDQLHAMAERYELLLRHPEQQTDEADLAGHYEPAKMLYWQMALLGVWPGVDPQQVTAQTLARHGLGGSASGSEPGDG